MEAVFLELEWTLLYTTREIGEVSNMSVFWLDAEDTWDTGYGSMALYRWSSSWEVGEVIMGGMTHFVR